MPTPPDQNIPRIVFKPFVRRRQVSGDSAPPGVRRPGPHPAPGTAASRVERYRGIVIRANNVDPRAFAAVQKVIDQLIGNNPSAVTKLATARTVIFVIPRDKRLTDLDEFANLRGETTQDGRRYEDLAGIGGHSLANENLAIAVCEENLVSIPGVRDVYGKGYSVATHEIAHAIYSKVLEPKQFSKVYELYTAQKQAAATHWTDDYAATNAREYFAQSTNAYFNQNAGIGHGGRDWLRANDPKMCTLLDEIYGPRAGAAPTPTPAPTPTRK
jgi:hypothetical protein